MMSVRTPSRYDVLLPCMSAVTPVGISNSTKPAVKNAFAANASRLFKPASSKKSVLIPQIREAARVLKSKSVRYVRRTLRASSFMLADHSFPKLANCVSHLTTHVGSLPLSPQIVRLPQMFSANLHEVTQQPYKSGDVFFLLLLSCVVDPLAEVFDPDVAIVDLAERGLESRGLLGVDQK